jgi:hypothetical protein
VQHINAANPTYLHFHAAATAGLIARGLDPVAAGRTANAVANSIIDQQASMLAYNSTSLTLGLLMLGTLPLLLLLPNRAHQVRAMNAPHV